MNIKKIIVVYEDGSTEEFNNDTFEFNDYNPVKIPIIPQKANCPRCGIDLSGSIGYVCGIPNCPSGLGGCQCES